MDVFEDLLGEVRAQRAMLGRSVFTPPWAIRYAVPAALSLTVFLRGDGWVRRGEAEPVRLRAGDVAVVRGGEPFVVADTPGTPVGITVLSDTECRIDGVDVAAKTALGPRTWGTHPDGAAALLVGAYGVAHAGALRLVEALDPVVVVPAADDPALAMLAAELSLDAPGQAVVLDRVFDLLLVRTLRAWLVESAPGWYRAWSDPVIGRAVRALHEQPQRPWTVAALAEEAGVSRAALARRFTDLVGEPPIAYLTQRRMALAADLLTDPGATVSAVARKVGYADAFSFGVAFKRTLGVSPGSYRRAGAARRR
ncbi:AraC family transcriptional regulator [Pseudonocardia sp. TRM90224]|uniref:AraC family transcriptional regulator n=1 Tax=Pseudonocardia sp. TRM90224 TaxID=2812678 RepID=UPI001E478A3A|nr:AraC family transcriptional regulator [Pseudonocardia sp. TRM90224]